MKEAGSNFTCKYCGYKIYKGKKCYRAGKCCRKLRCIIKHQIKKLRE